MTNQLTRIHLAPTILEKLIHIVVVKLQICYMATFRKKGKKWHEINEKIRNENYELFQNS